MVNTTICDSHDIDVSIYVLIFGSRLHKVRLPWNVQIEIDFLIILERRGLEIEYDWSICQVDCLGCELVLVQMYSRYGGLVGEGTCHEWLIVAHQVRVTDAESVDCRCAEKRVGIYCCKYFGV